MTKDCSKCMLSEATYHFHTCIPGVGPSPAPVMLIGDAPGNREDMLGTPFVGSAGKLLDRILIALSVDREGIFITNAFRCKPANNDLPKKSQLLPCWEACKPYLVAELKRVKPKVVVLMGSTTLSLVGGVQPITKYEGMELEPDVLGWKCRVFASFHPAYSLRAASKEIRIAMALERAFKAAGIETNPGGIVDGKVMYPYEIKE